MLSATDTLKVGDKAPDFVLNSANREAGHSLGELTKKGAVIVEFLRGTW